MRTTTARLLLAFARTPAGGLAAGLACTYAARLLPLARLADCPRAIAFRHPAPEVAEHIVIVPKLVVPTLCVALDRGRAEVLLDILEVALVAASALSPRERVVTVNVGVRQDVRQLHAHLLPVEGARQLLSESLSIGMLDGSSGTLVRVLTAATEALAGCAPDTDASLLVRDFESPHRAEVLVSIASGGRRR